MQAGELDFPPENQALQASKDFQFETGLALFYISAEVFSLVSSNILTDITENE